tara:strand:+ start:1890 stop:2078 length:189 start_codon:yes stop_codon:yes gene_type:complete
VASTSITESDHAQIADWVEQFHRNSFLFMSDDLDAALAEHVYRDANERLRVLLGFLPGGAYE